MKKLDIIVTVGMKFLFVIILIMIVIGLLDKFREPQMTCVNYHEEESKEAIKYGEYIEKEYCLYGLLNDSLKDCVDGLRDRYVEGKTNLNIK